MVPSNDYSWDIERENAVLILPQQDYIFGKFHVLGALYVYAFISQPVVHSSNKHYNSEFITHQKLNSLSKFAY